MHFLKKHASLASPKRHLLRAKTLFFLMLLSLATALPTIWAQETAPTGNTPPTVLLAELDGPIGPAAADHVRRVIDRAANGNAALIVFQLDTPGGLDTSMRDIVSAILASEIPVATWVAPSGARAASAGTYILAASNIAAMAPATNVGSSTPINMSGPDNAEGGRSDAEQKAVNDAIAYLQGLQELRGRNVDWATETVADARNLSASEALQEGVVDLVARDLDELLAAADLEGARVERLETSWRHDFLSVITNPNIAYILLMIGVYGLILEFYSPGLGIPGVTGVICLLVGAYAMQMLPISYAGLALMAIGIGLIAFEVISPSFGVFGLGGLAAFVLGSIMLMDTDSPAWQISLPLIAAISVATGAMVILVLGAALKARQQPQVTGDVAMAEMTAVAMEDFEQRGHVHVSGETWTAISDTPVHRGQRLRIRQIDGLLLHVSPQLGDNAP